MSEGPEIAVVGGAGLVGREILSLLRERRVGGEEPRVLGRQEEIGEAVDVGGRELPIRPLTDAAFEGITLAFFACGPRLAAEHAGAAAEAGAAVIDLSSRFRLEEDVPLVVAEVNPEALEGWRERGIVACPSSTSVALASVLAPLRAEAGLRRVVASTYQGAAGGGRGRLEGLARETTSLLNGRRPPRPRFARRLAFNCVPQVGPLLDDGSTEHEARVRAELRRVLADPELAMHLTAVRVPVFHGVGIALAVETETPLSPAEAVALLRQSPGLLVHEGRLDPYATPADAVVSQATHVGRIRADESTENGLGLWLAFDAVRKGAALNAVAVGELLLRDYL